jgi:hypothetical protein
VRVSAAGRTEVVDIEVVDAEPPTRIVERNISAGGHRRATGTYTLRPLSSGGTKVEFEYAWERAPLIDRLTAPATRAILRRANTRAMERLTEQLGERVAGQA